MTVSGIKVIKQAEFPNHDLLTPVNRPKNAPVTKESVLQTSVAGNELLQQGYMLSKHICERFFLNMFLLLKGTLRLYFGLFWSVALYPEQVHGFGTRWNGCLLLLSTPNSSELPSSLVTRTSLTRCLLQDGRDCLRHD